MNKILLVAITMIPLFAFAQSKEEAQKILDKTKVHYLNVNFEFDQKNPVMFLDKDNNRMGYPYLDATVKSRPHCFIHANRESYNGYVDSQYYDLMLDLRDHTNIERLKYRREGSTVKFFYEQADPWFEENPVITCHNVIEKNPLDLVMKLYDTNVKYESMVNGKKTVIKALHPNDPTTCIVAGEEYVKLDKLMKEVTSFGTLDLNDKVFIDGKVGTLVSINKKKGMVRFDGERIAEKVDLFGLRKVEPAREYKYREGVRLLEKKPSYGQVYGQIIEDGERKIIVSKTSGIETVSPSIIMKLK